MKLCTLPKRRRKWALKEQRTTASLSAPPLPAPHQETVAKSKNPQTSAERKFLCAVHIINALMLTASAGYWTVGRHVLLERKQAAAERFYQAAEEFAGKRYIENAPETLLLPDHRTLGKKDVALNEKALLYKTYIQYTDFYNELKTIDAFLKERHADPVTQENVDAFNNAAEAMNKMTDPVAKLMAAAGFSCIRGYSNEKLDSYEKLFSIPDTLKEGSWTASIQDLLKAGSNEEKMDGPLNSAMVCADQAALTGVLLVRAGFSQKNVYQLCLKRNDPATGKPLYHAVAAAEFDGRVHIIDNRSTDKGIAANLPLSVHYFNASRSNVLAVRAYFSEDSPWTLLAAIDMTGNIAAFKPDAAQKAGRLSIPIAHTLGERDQALLNEVGLHASIAAVNAGVASMESTIEDKFFNVYFDAVTSSINN